MFNFLQRLKFQRVNTHLSNLKNLRLTKWSAKGMLPIAILSIVFAMFFAVKTPAQTTKNSYKFDFGTGKTATGFTSITEKNIYNRETGYGFEPGASVSCVDRVGRDALRADFCTSDRPFYFSVAVPEGNYKVILSLGDSKQSTVTTVKAELRRLMLEKVETKIGEFTSQSFIVNVRNPQISTGGAVNLKEREKTMEWWAWDEKLTLEFNNSRPAVNAIEIEKVSIPTVYLLGDSTVCDQPREPYNSWGQMLTRFFAPGIAVANHAESGESLKSSLGARRLDKVLSLIKPGDFLMIQFGHNHEKAKAAYALAVYKANLKRFVEEARKKGATPILVTPMHRRTFDANGKIINSHGDYPAIVRQVAQEDKVVLIDLNEMSKTLHEALGTEKSGLLFKEGDATHHSNYGSYELAKCIVQAIKTQKLSLARFLIKDLPPFNPSLPDAAESFQIPASPVVTDVKPLGS